LGQVAKKVERRFQILTGFRTIHPVADHRGDFLQQLHAFLLGVRQAGRLDAFREVQGGPQPGYVGAIPRGQQEFRAMPGDTQSIHRFHVRKTYR